jgi:hypothetical protein
VAIKVVEVHKVSGVLRGGVNDCTGVGIKAQLGSRKRERRRFRGQYSEETGTRWEFGGRLQEGYWWGDRI